jgi:hypothetical protein
MMRKYLFFVFYLFFGLISCKNKAPITARPDCEVQAMVLPQDTSYLSTPLVIPTQLIEDKLNRAFRQDIVNDDDFDNQKEGGGADKLKMKVTRLGDVQVTWENNVAKYHIPLLILVEREIIPKRALRLPRSLAIKTKFSLRLGFETNVNIGEDWKLVSKTEFRTFEWLSEVKALGGLIDLKKIVEKGLLKKMPQTSANMDAEIREKVHIKPAITRVWQQLQKPMIINRKEKLLWLKINPIRFEMGKITTQKGNLLVQTRLTATTETLVGDNPAYSIDSTLPRLIKRRTLPNEGYVYVSAEIPFTDLNEVINCQLAGRVLDLEGHKIEIVQAKTWGCGTNLVLHLQVKGEMVGDLYFQGTPRYEADSQRIVIQNFDYELKTQEMLMKGADWLMHDKFKEQIKKELTLPLGEKMELIPDLIERGIERGRAGKKMDFIIEQWDFKPQQVWVQSTHIKVLVVVNARVRVELEKI